MNSPYLASAMLAREGCRVSTFRSLDGAALPTETAALASRAPARGLLSLIWLGWLAGRAPR